MNVVSFALARGTNGLVLSDLMDWEVSFAILFASSIVFDVDGFMFLGMTMQSPCLKDVEKAGVWRSLKLSTINFLNTSFPFSNSDSTCISR